MLPLSFIIIYFVILLYSSPGGTERLFDLIKVQDEKLKTAFYFALKDTLVADNLEVATRIAYPKVRGFQISLSASEIPSIGLIGSYSSDYILAHMFEIDV